MVLNINSLISIEISNITATDDSVLPELFFSYFTTEMTPLYGSTSVVRSILGTYIEDISDDIINQLLLKHSILAQDLVNACHIDMAWVHHATEWSVLKTALVILYNGKDFRSNLGGKLYKQLGDFSTSKESAMGPGFMKLLDWLNCEIFKYEHAIKFCVPPAISCEGLTNYKAMPYAPRQSEWVEKGSFDINKVIPGRDWITFQYGVTYGDNRLYMWGRKYGTNMNTLGYRSGYQYMSGY